MIVFGGAAAFLAVGAVSWAALAGEGRPTGGAGGAGGKGSGGEGASERGPAERVRRNPNAGRELYRAERGDFDMVIPVSGELAAQRQVEVRNKLDGRAVITEIVPEGRSVKQGETLLRLSEEELGNKIKDAED